MYRKVRYFLCLFVLAFIFFLTGCLGKTVSSQVDINKLIQITSTMSGEFYQHNIKTRVLNQDDGKFQSNFKKFNGDFDITRFVLKADEKVVVNYSSKVTKGSFGFVIEDPEKNSIQKIQPNTTDSIVMKAHASGIYTLKMIGENAFGEVNLSWKGHEVFK